MAESNWTLRYISEKIALPLILVISLFAAWLMTGVRSVIRLSAPIELDRSGLSISMPQGNGWQCEGKWLYEDAGFSITSVFSTGQQRTASSRVGIGTAYAHCHYMLASKEESLQDSFSQKAAEIGGKIIETGQVATGQLTFDWAKIRKESGKSGRMSYEMVFGVCRLPAGRWLETEVLQTEEEQDLAQRVFEKVVKSARFSDNGLLQAGIGIVSEAKKSGLGADSELLASAKPFGEAGVFNFILTDAHGRKIGFMMNVMVFQTDKEPAVRAADYYYGRGIVPDEKVSSFRSDNSFDKFTWRAESSSSQGGKGTEMSADSGALTVRRLQSGGEEKEFAIGAAAVPDIVLEPVLKNAVDSNQRELIIDVIRSDGTIAPVHVEKMDREDSNGSSLKLEILDGRGFWQQIYFDSSKKPIKILLGQSSTYTFTRADANEIVKAFPERAYLVHDETQLLDREGL